MVAIQWSGTTELVFVMERFHSYIIMVLGWGEGGLRNLAMIGFGDSMVVKNGYNSCYKEWHFGGTNQFGDQIEKN
jgi:hypothetical protein